MRVKKPKNIEMKGSTPKNATASNKVAGNSYEQKLSASRKDLKTGPAKTSTASVKTIDHPTIDLSENSGQLSSLPDTETFDKKHRTFLYDIPDKKHDPSIIDVADKPYPLTNTQPTNIKTQVVSNQLQGYSYSSYDPYEYRLGDKYKEKLNLSSQEVSWLNRFWQPNNVFLSIEGCCVTTIKLYVVVLKALAKQLQKNETTLAKELNYFQTELLKKYQGSSWDTSYLKEQMEADVYLTIFKRAENSVREAYGHKRKLTGEFPYSNLASDFEHRIGKFVEQITRESVTTVNQPDDATEIELNAQNVNRWKLRFEQLCSSFSEHERKEFIDGIHTLARQNSQNPAIENIYFETSKFIAKYDKIEALKCYIYYLHHDLKSEKIDKKQLAKTIQKSLFKNNDELHVFEKVVADLVNTNDLETALKEVQKVYEPKRRKIQLDVKAIEVVREKDKGTVEKLNEFLQDEYMDENTSIIAQEINNEEVKLDITTKSNEIVASPFIPDLSLNVYQREAIALFVTNAFSMSQNDFEAFCKAKGVFKNQLIESINEACYEIIDDLLIEEDSNNYQMNQNYYERLL